ncbi:Oxidoreductase BOA17 [Pseudocercospora fuligena]|uniref:Oxidoreductase BOA17 n=1 Tax=Pseudocercospora fuligena TaxID=685502 RepID=A0A8H6VFA6_9PEZI|nr:Oxidoreductase BOA17 [Pseudocercospora fuligena]
MPSQKSLVWLITGCSQGLGEAMAKEALQRGEKVIATARDKASIQHLEKLGATTLALDVTWDAATIAATVEVANAVHGKIDVLVNNAGSLQLGAAEDMTAELLLPEFKTNVFGTLNVTKAVMPYFRKQGKGQIVLISSAAVWTGGLGLGAHAASKAAIQALFENFSNEVKASGIKTLILQPGSFRTNIARPDKYNFPPTENYKETMEWMEDHLAGLHGTQKNDPVRFAKVAVDLVKQEGSAEGKEVPETIMIAHNAVEMRRQWLQKEMEKLNQWETVIVSTGYEE